jgi:hypothetical protein
LPVLPHSDQEAGGVIAAAIGANPVDKPLTSAAA